MELFVPAQREAWVNFDGCIHQTVDAPRHRRAGVLETPQPTLGVEQILHLSSETHASPFVDKVSLKTAGAPWRVFVACHWGRMALYPDLPSNKGPVLLSFPVVV